MYWSVSDSVSEKVVCVCVWCVCVLFVHLFQDDLRCLFIPHQVNHGGVQKPPVEVSLYKSHTPATNLSGDTEVAGTVRYCLVIRDKSEPLVDEIWDSPSTEDTQEPDSTCHLCVS